MISAASLPPSVLSVVQRFDRAGVEVFLVGGCVRDLLRGVLPHDFDFCTAAEPGEIKNLFPGVPCLETGIRHGTVTVVMDGEPFEITTYRVDGTYEDHRKPRAVTFTRSLCEDCRRRDFTVNAMAYHPVRGLSDFFGGQRDLADRMIRCVGDPDTRFSEDALRILRALRFSACLDFSIEDRTAAALHTAAPLLRHVSGERIAAEWKKLLSGLRLPALLGEYRDVVAVFFPFADTFSDTDIVPMARICDAVSDIAARMAGFMYLCGIREAEAASAVMARLPFDRAFVNRCIRICSRIGAPTPVTRYDVRRNMAQYGAVLPDILALHAAVIFEDAALCHAAAAVYADVLLRGEPVSRAALAVSGRDLVERGFRGKAVGAMLDRLLDAVMRDTIPNTYDALCAYADTASGITE